MTSTAAPGAFASSGAKIASMWDCAAAGKPAHTSTADSPHRLCPSVHRKRRARHVGGGIGEQEHHNGGDPLGRHPLGSIFRRAPFAVGFGVDRARQDRIDGDAGVAILEGGVLDERQERGFRSGISCDAGGRLDGGATPDRDDSPAACLRIAESPREGVEGGAHVDVHHLVPHGVVGLVERASGETAGDVHERVDAPALRDHRLDDPAACAELFRSAGTARKRWCEKSVGSDVARRSRYERAGCQQCVCNVRAQTAFSAGNQHDLLTHRWFYSNLGANLMAVIRGSIGVECLYTYPDKWV